MSDTNTFVTKATVEGSGPDQPIADHGALLTMFLGLFLATRGPRMVIEIQQEEFDPWKRLDRFQRESLPCRGQYGATAIFVGTMRDLNEGLPVETMTLEHYPEMSEKYLANISEVAQQRWDVLETFIVHRVGRLVPNETIVLVAVWSVHRAEAFAACRYLIEELKSHAPFWKKEQFGRTERWVVDNTPG